MLENTDEINFKIPEFKDVLPYKSLKLIGR